MQYAIVKGTKTEPVPGLKGSCPACAAAAVAKCGPKVMWHWSHSGRRHCDPWWENETEWHRGWKACFAADRREVVHFDRSGEKHVADVKTETGMVIEFQNSAMSLEELRSREAFYGKMIWIVNAQPFQRRFFIMSALPDPKSELAKDAVFGEQRPDWLGRCYWRRSENPHYRDERAMVLIHSMRDIEDDIYKEYVGHHLFHWKNTRDVWYQATCPVFFDFGDEVLWWLQVYDDRGLRSVRWIWKADLVAKNGGTPAHIPTATGSSPLHCQRV